MALPPESVMIGALAGYVILVIIVGIVYGKMRRKTEEEYLVAGRRAGWISTAFTMTATIASGGVYLGTVGLFYTHGLNLVTYGFAFVGMTPILLWIVGKRLWKVGKAYGYSTPQDFYSDRYNSPFLRISGSLGSLLFLVPYFASGAVATGLLFEQFTGISYSVGVVALLLACLVYTMYGGMRAVIYTDVLQGALLLGVGFISIFALWSIAGGYTAVVEAVPTTIYAPTVGSIAFFVGWFFFMALHPITMGDRMTRMYSIKSVFQLKRAVILTSILLFIMSTTFLTLGLVSRALTPIGVVAADQAFPTTLMNYLPAMTPFLLIIVWACGMSTIDSGLVGSSAMLSKDILRKGLKKDITEGGMVLAGRLVMIPLILFAAWIAIERPSSIWFLIGMTVSFFIQFAPMLIGGLYWKRATKIAAEVSWVVAMFFVVLFQFFVTAPLGVWGGIWALIPNTIVFIVLSYLTKPMPDEHLNKFWSLFK